MKYTYVEFGDGTLVTFNDIRKDKNGEHIDVYFERPVDTGFDYLQISLPDLDTAATEGYSKAEIADLKSFAADNEALIWEMAREGAGPCVLLFSFKISTYSLAQLCYNYYISVCLRT